MSTTRRSLSGHTFVLMTVAFLGIFVYGLLTALPGSVLPTLERNRFLPDDAVAGTFLLINAIGAIVSYLVSGPITDRIGKKFTLSVGAGLVIVSMIGFALTVNNIEATSALPFIFACSLVLGLGANAIVSAGHALVADVAETWRNSALNLLDVCFGLGLMALPTVMTLPQLKDDLQGREGLGLIFYALAAVTVALLIFILAPRFPKPSHPESFPVKEAKDLFKNASFWLLAIALFMYVGAEVALGKWVVSLLQRDPGLLTSAGLSADLQEMARTAPDFFETNQMGKSIADFALRTLSLFGVALIIGRLISSFLLGVMRMNSFLLLIFGSALSSIGLLLISMAGSAGTVRWAVVATGIGMGPIFPTSVGLASVIVPRIAGTAMSWVMMLGFTGLLVIPPAVGYISEAVGGQAGDVRAGLLSVLAASVLMLLLHIVLAMRERRRVEMDESELEMDAVAKEV